MKVYIFRYLTKVTKLYIDKIQIKRRKIMGITCKQTGKIRGIMRKLEIENEKNRKAENKEKSKKDKKENK